MIGVIFDPTKLVDEDHKGLVDAALGVKRVSDATDKVIENFEDWLAGQRDKPFHFEFVLFGLEGPERLADAACLLSQVRILRALDLGILWRRRALPA